MSNVIALPDNFNPKSIRWYWKESNEPVIKRINPDLLLIKPTIRVER